MNDRILTIGLIISPQTKHLFFNLFYLLRNCYNLFTEWCHYNGISCIKIFSRCINVLVCGVTKIRPECKVKRGRILWSERTITGFQSLLSWNFIKKMRNLFLYKNRNEINLLRNLSDTFYFQITDAVTNRFRVKLAKFDFRFTRLLVIYH